MHDVMAHRDIGRLEDHVDGHGLSSVKDYNPQQLYFDPVAGTYLDCHTGQVPTFTVQFSEVGAAGTPAPRVESQLVNPLNSGVRVPLAAHSLVGVGATQPLGTVGMDDAARDTRGARRPTGPDPRRPCT